jgi:thiosulfate/3-mercaptopyruvate sulfurtransferase
VQIIDVRTKAEFSGDDIRALRGGHIPGALNIPYEENWADPDTPAKLSKKLVSDNSGMSLKTRDDLKKLYAKLDPQKETVVYCQSGVRAAETATVLSSLGFSNVKVYDSSWLAYGNQVDLPAENVQFFNVGVLNMKMSAMQSRIESLERELAEARGRK